ncbi:TolC family protein [Ravibacter arvi]
MKKILFLFCCLMQAVISGAQTGISVRDELSEEYLQRLIETARTNYPKLKVLDSRIEGAGYAVKKARLSYFDIFSFSYLFMPGWQQATVNPLMQTSYQFGFFANVGSLIQKPAQVRQARSEQNAIGHEKAAFELNLEAEVRQRYYTYIQKKTLLRVVAESLLDLESIRKSVRYKFEKGEETLENYNKALLACSNQMQAKVTIEGEILIAKSALEELLGQKMEGIK